MDIHEAAVGIALLNYKINILNKGSISYDVPFDKQQVSNERGKLLMYLKIEMPYIDFEEIITRIEPNAKKDTDIFLIKEQIKEAQKHGPGTRY